MSDFVACPCCGYPTLGQREAHEICTICWWEDDGQDNDDANVVRGGPNGPLSLTAARANFADHLDMHDADTGIGVVANPSPERKALLSYIGTLRAGQPFDERKLHSLLRGQADAMRRDGL